MSNISNSLILNKNINNNEEVIDLANSPLSCNNITQSNNINISSLNDVEYENIKEDENKDLNNNKDYLVNNFKSTNNNNIKLNFINDLYCLKTKNLNSSNENVQYNINKVGKIKQYFDYKLSDSLNNNISDPSIKCSDFKDICYKSTTSKLLNFSNNQILFKTSFEKEINELLLNLNENFYKRIKTIKDNTYNNINTIKQNSYNLLNEIDIKYKCIINDKNNTIKNLEKLLKKQHKIIKNFKLRSYNIKYKKDKVNKQAIKDKLNQDDNSK